MLNIILYTLVKYQYILKRNNFINKQIILQFNRLRALTNTLLDIVRTALIQTNYKHNIKIL